MLNTKGMKGVKLKPTLNLGCVKRSVSSHSKSFNVWNPAVARRRMMDSIAEQLGIQTQHDWYSFSTVDVKRLPNATNFVQNHFCNSLLLALRTVYPEFDWNPLSFRNVPRNYWKEIQNQRDLFDFIAQEMKVEKQEDWYNVTGTDVKNLGGSGLLKIYKGSIYSALKTIYPEFIWDPLKFNFSVPSTHVREKTQKTARELFDLIAERLHVQKQQDWYSVTPKEVCQHGGLHYLTSHFNGSLFTALKTVYPEYIWNFELFHHVPLNSRKDLKTHREIFDEIAEDLGINTQEDWYLVSGEDVKSVAHSAILQTCYNDSLFTALQSVYSEFEWNPLRFAFPPLNWQHKYEYHQVKAFMDDITKLNSTSQFSSLLTT